MILGITMQQAPNMATSPHVCELLEDDKQQLQQEPSNHYEGHAHLHTDMEQMHGYGMPPQQVYLNGAGVHMDHPPNLVGLESQFESLGFRQEEASLTEPSSTQTNQNGDEEEGEEGDDEPVKLFVGQVRTPVEAAS
jgi:hypothetical protein